SRYTNAQLAHYAELCKDWLKEGKHVWAYFNNDIHGYAWGDALRFKKLF
ncbi:MAG: DUF72 domain-containing protein, partial [Chitinophagaceae bacterium]